LPGDALIDRNSMQPRRNLGFAAKISQVAEGRQESFLSGVTRILFAAEHAKAESKNPPFPPAHNFPESFRVAGERSLNHLLVVRSRFHLVYPQPMRTKCRA
jgi:hypothetical protein